MFWPRAAARYHPLSANFGTGTRSSQVAVVTGASRGIGHFLSHSLARRGVTVAGLIIVVHALTKKPFQGALKIVWRALCTPTSAM